MPDGEGVGDKELPPPRVEVVVAGVPDAGGAGVGVGETIDGEALGPAGGVCGAGSLTSIESGLLLAVWGTDRLLMI